jgi:fibronectin type 3 domain-containing protein
MRRALWVFLLAAGCSNDNGYSGPPGGDLPAPTNLSYTVTPGGPAAAPTATLLQWDLPSSSVVVIWNVYSRTSTSESFGLRGTTTSNSFHDQGVPELQYYVTALDEGGFESPASNTVTVDERLTLPPPTELGTTSLDGAVALFWTDNAFEADPQGFQAYRVYSAPYDLDQDRCGDWALEGTTVAPEFISGALPNGVPRCFGVSAQTIEGFESLWSPIRDDTPRFESRNVALYAPDVNAAQASFRFWRDADADAQVDDAELGRVGAATDATADAVVERGAGSVLQLRIVRAGTTAQQYGTGPVADLTSIDFAPVTGYTTATIVPQPGYGYVFQMSGLANDGFLRFGGMRVTHVGQSFLLVDWSYQGDPGNPQLLRQ